MSPSTTTISRCPPASSSISASGGVNGIFLQNTQVNPPFNNTVSVLNPTLAVLPAAIVAGYQFPLLIALLGSGRRQVGREVGVTLLRTAVRRHGLMPASRGGKLKTLVQAVAIGLFILPLSGAWLTVAMAIMWLAVVLTVLTGVLRGLQELGSPSELLGSSYGAGTYGMSGRAFDNRFTFLWPTAKIAIMGPRPIDTVGNCQKSGISHGCG